MSDFYEFMRKLQAQRERRERWGRRLGCVLTILVAFALGLAFVYGAARVWQMAQ